MSNFIYYEHIEDYEEQVRKAKLCDEKDKEIESLKDEVMTMRKLYFEIRDRNNKAIEYIEDNSNKFNSGVDEDYYSIELYEEDIKTLLDILKGEDKE